MMHSEATVNSQMPNYMFKPTPELTLRLLWLGGRRGLTWR